ncbi:penicillin-binding protein 1B [Motiliproteus sp.]|uniref:penicillin-binding protein 1B n=1 Tax=Motiliproteus sp. TaxID=1898955 RepID=UPI003BAA8B12
MAKKSVKSKAAAAKAGKAKKSGQRRSLWGLLFKLGLALSVLAALGLVYLDASIRSKFEGKRWALPAKVYARPLELYAGRDLRADELAIELKQLGYRMVDRPRRPGEAKVQSWRVELVSRGFEFADGAEPSRPLDLRFGDGRLQTLSSGGRSLAVARLEPVLVGGIYPADNEDRELVKLDQVPETLVQALIAVEDRNFYTHHGISLKGIARAMWANVRAGRLVQGGSTLTQQLVKNYFLTSERSLARKLTEAPMAMLLELHYSKDEILQAYLNEVYLGQAGSRAIHGFGLASNYYFGRPLDSLSVDQLALLAGLVKGPSYYDPRRRPERATQRRNLVLKLLGQQGLISEAQAEQLSRRPLGVVAKSSLTKGAFPAYLDLVKRQLRKEYRQEDLSSEGLQVFTSLDPIVQRQAEASLKQVTARLQKHHGKKLKGLQGAMVVANSQTGEVVAVVGDREPRYQGFNRALDAIRPIGSLVKPAVYLAALERPEQYTLSTPIEDQPLQLQNPDGSVWSPNNFDKKAHGRVPLHQALSRSYNLATANLGMDQGMARVIDALERLGVRRDIKPYPATLLGSLSLSPLEVSQLYQTIAANGFETPQRAIRSVLTAEGSLLSSYPFELQQQFDPAPIHLLQYALQETVREGTAKSLYRRFPGSLNMAGKTGTTNDQRDSWFAGFTGDYLAVVWLGHDDNRPTPLTGSSGALKVWAELMAKLRPASYQAVPPPNVEYLWVDESLGAQTEQGCPNARLIPFIAGSEPQTKHSCGLQAPVQRASDWFRRLFGG